MRGSFAPRRLCLYRSLALSLPLPLPPFPGRRPPETGGLAVVAPAVLAAGVASFGEVGSIELFEVNAPIWASAIGEGRAVALAWSTRERDGARVEREVKGQEKRVSTGTPTSNFAVLATPAG